MSVASPRLTPAGDLLIPFDADARHRWWAGGQSILATLDELGAPRHIRLCYDADAARDGGALTTRMQLERVVTRATRKELERV